MFTKSDTFAILIDAFFWEIFGTFYLIWTILDNLRQFSTAKTMRISNKHLFEQYFNKIWARNITLPSILRHPVVVFIVIMCFMKVIHKVCQKMNILILFFYKPYFNVQGVPQYCVYFWHSSDPGFFNFSCRVTKFDTSFMKNKTTWSILTMETLKG